MFPEQLGRAALWPDKEDQMTDRLTRLLDTEAVSGDDRFPIRALFHEPQTRHLKAAAVDIGGWLDRREVLVSLDRFGPPSEDGWPISLGRDELQDAPEWERTHGLAMAMPPLIVGPFGYTFSPMLMAAGMNESAERSLPDMPEQSGPDLIESEDGRFAGLERTSDWLDRDAFGPDGHMGKVRDLVLENLTITALVLDSDRSVPLSRLRHMAREGYFVFD